ncbi:Hypothetical predicted protein [Mytilus galloprovincialis]|uniref:Uncharacterized protein n=2 Tax=Mytilus galloprovincialis TaxID=29158 RepID=A0A8B6E2M5_MYTGA|nr:Hypothetical predicted protein [Mytilus galloprovincialis]
MTSEIDPALLALSGSKIEILISCNNLADLDEFTKTDPMCVMSIKQFGQWKEYGRTEAIRNTLNPRFVSSFIVNLEPSVTQHLKFSLYDIDSRSQELKHHDFVGFTDVTLDKLLNYPKTVCTTSKNLRTAGDSRPRGMINITTEILKDSKNKVSIHAQGHKLDKKGLFSMNKPDVYLEISRSIENIVYLPVYRTEIVYKSTNPRWRPFEISLQKLCNTEWDRNIEFSCWHYSGSNYHLIGRKITSLRDMNNQTMNGHYKEVPLSSPKKEKSGKKKPTYTGSLRFYQFRVDLHYTLLDFIRGGLELNLVIAIDFTASNGNIDEELSLHNISDIRDNQYLDAIETLGSLITQYNHDRQVTTFGFGAKWTNRDLPYCFPLTGDQNRYTVKGIKAVTEAYETAVCNLKFGGPTCVAHVIEKAANIAERENISQNKQVYSVLLIITDGVINDLDRTIRRVVSVSHLPLSIIIIGVGPADFSLMGQFNSDREVKLKNDKTKEEALRRNTYFAAFKKDNTNTSANISAARESFAALSMQILEYMKINSIHPNKAKLLRTEKEWFDPDNEKDDMEVSSKLIKVTSSASLSGLSHNGPSCPTCGAQIEPGSNLYSDIDNCL